MNLCLDTSAILKLKKEPELLDDIAKKGDLLFTTTITQYELLVGAHFYGKREKEFVDDILNSLIIVSVEKHLPLAAKVTAELMKKGKRINDLDVIIASTCIANNLKIVTGDEDFEKIAEVMPLEYLII
jgi:predicted nucleic acid-binding protein